MLQLGRPCDPDGGDQATVSAVSRSGGYGTGRPGLWARSWHVWRTGASARLAAARMYATAANRAYCQKSSACHQATSSSRSGSVPPGGLLRPARPGAWCSACRGTCTRARTVRVVPPTVAGQPGWPCTSSACPRRGGGTPRREGVVPRVQRRKLAHQLEDVSVAGQLVEQGLAGDHGVLGSGPLPGRHITTVRQNHRSPGGLTGGCPPPTGAAQCRRLPVTLCLCLMSCVTHVNRRSARLE